MNVIEFDNQLKQLLVSIPSIKGYARVVDDNQATKKLNDKTGIQLVAVLPSYSANGTAGMKSDAWNTFFWVLEKGDPSQTEEKELQQYKRCEDAIHALKDELIESQENGCGPFWRLEIASIIIEADFNAFGGWNGYFMNVTF